MLILVVFLIVGWFSIFLIFNNLFSILCSCCFNWWRCWCHAYYCNSKKKHPTPNISFFSKNQLKTIYRIRMSAAARTKHPRAYVNDPFSNNSLTVFFFCRQPKKFIWFGVVLLWMTIRGFLMSLMIVWIVWIKTNRIQSWIYTFTLQKYNFVCQFFC